MFLQKIKSHVLRVIRELLYIKPREKSTSIKGVIDFFMFVAKRKSVVFLISDYIDEILASLLKIANRKHDLIGCQIARPIRDKAFQISIIERIDPESGEAFD